MKFIPIALLLISLSSCQFTKQQKAEHLVKLYLDSVLNDPHSYESVSFDTVYNLHATVFNNNEYNSSFDSVNSITTDINVSKGDLQFSFTNHKELKTKIKSDRALIVFYKSKMDSIEKAFKPYDYGYAIEHVYRAKNGFGALGLHKGIFIFNKELTKVVNVNDEN